MVRSLIISNIKFALFFFYLTYFRERGQKYKNIFVRFLVQMKTSKSHSEINWPLGKNTVRQTWNQKLVYVKKHVQIDRGRVLCLSSRGLFLHAVAVPSLCVATLWRPRGVKSMPSPTNPLKIVLYLGFLRTKLV